MPNSDRSFTRYFYCLLNARWAPPPRSVGSHAPPTKSLQPKENYMSEEVFDLNDYIKHTPRFAARLVQSVIKPVTTQDVDPAPMQKLDALIAIRESSEFDYGLFEGMIAQVLQPISAQYPELEALMEHGSRILRTDADGTELRSHLGAEALYGDDGSSNKPTAWAINIGRCRVIYALASAGKTDSTGLENSWVNVLAEEIRTNIPTHLYTGPFSRLVRNRDVSAPLVVALRVTGTRVHCLESREGFLVNNDSGSMLWHAFVASAHSEWVSTLTRLQTGFIFHTKQGKWAQGGPIPVIGYKRVTETQGGPSLVAPDETQRALVRTIIEAAASGLSEDEALKKISNAGARSRKPRGKGVEQPLLADLGDFRSAVRRVWQHLPTYLSGEYVSHRANTVPGLVECLGVPVQRDRQGDNGYFQFRIPFGIPEGGWCDEETLKLAIKRRLGKRQKEGGKGNPLEFIKPLTGLGSYIIDGYEYRLMGDDTTYQVRRRPHQPTDSGVFKGFAQYESDLVGRFTIVGLHNTVASLLRSLVLEVNSDLICAHQVEPKPAELEDLLNRAEEASRVATRMREFAGSATDIEEQDAYRAQASEQLGLARSLHQQHKELLSTQDRQVAFADTSQILAAAELLDRSSGGEPPALRRALRRVIGNMRIDTAINEPLAQVSLTAIVRTDFGAITLGPVTRSILNTAGTKRVKPSPGKESERNIRLAHDLLMSDPKSSVRDVLNLQGRAERRRLSSVLQSLLPNPQAASALLDCPIPEVQRVVLNEVFTEYGYSRLALPDDLDPLWVQEIAAIYLQPTWDWNKKSWASGDATWARRIISWVHRYYGDENGVSVSLARDQLGVSEPQMYSLLCSDVRRYRTILRSRLTPIEYVQNYKKYTTSKEPRRLRLMLCPHCGTRELPHILRVPELPDGFLCSTCRRPPSSKIVFPPQYLQPWVGPNQGKRKIKTPQQDKEKSPAGTQLFAFRIPPRQTH